MIYVGPFSLLSMICRNVFSVSIQPTFAMQEPFLRSSQYLLSAKLAIAPSHLTQDAQLRKPAEAPDQVKHAITKRVARISSQGMNPMGWRNSSRTSHSSFEPTADSHMMHKFTWNRLLPWSRPRSFIFLIIEDPAIRVSVAERLSNLTKKMTKPSRSDRTIEPPETLIWKTGWQIRRWAPQSIDCCLVDKSTPEVGAYFYSPYFFQPWRLSHETRTTCVRAVTQMTPLDY